MLYFPKKALINLKPSFYYQYILEPKTTLPSIIVVHINASN